MLCWACERATEPAHALCSSVGRSCRLIRPADHFCRASGCRARYDLDVGALEARYRELTRKLHPDRFARADPRARRASLGRSVQLNEAWRTLKDPVKRAEYLLGLLGVEVAPEAGGKVPAELLAEILELREALGEARLGGDDATVQKMAVEMRGRVATSLAAVSRAVGRRWLHVGGATGRSGGGGAGAGRAALLPPVPGRGGGPRRSVAAARAGGPSWLTRCSRSPSRASRASRPRAAGRAVGIDLGTTNSLVAVVKDGQPVCLRDRGRRRDPCRRWCTTPPRGRWSSAREARVAAGARASAGHHRLGEALHGARPRRRRGDAQADAVPIRDGVCRRSGGALRGRRRRAR